MDAQELLRLSRQCNAQGNNVRITFQDRSYIMVGGAITTPELYGNGEPSYAHLGEDGMIRRYHQIIGTSDDIEVVGKDDTRMSDDGAIRMIANFLGWEMVIMDANELIDKLVKTTEGKPNAKVYIYDRARIMVSYDVGDEGTGTFVNFINLETGEVTE